MFFRLLWQVTCLALTWYVCVTPEKQASKYLRRAASRWGAGRSSSPVLPAWWLSVETEEAGRVRHLSLAGYENLEIVALNENSAPTRVIRRLCEPVARVCTVVGPLLTDRCQCQYFGTWILRQGILIYRLGGPLVRQVTSNGKSR